MSARDCFNKFFRVDLDEVQLEKVVGYWTTTWVLDPSMAALAEKLKQKYRLLLFSNSDPLNSPNYQKGGWYKYFDLLLLSHKEGLMKPDPEFYSLLVSRGKLDPTACVFIDDQEKVLPPAEAIGMQTILYQGIDALKEDLKKLGVTV